MRHTADHLDDSADWSLPRTTSLAVAIGVHVGALLLLAMPVMQPVTIAAITTPIEIIFEDPKPEPVVLPIPPEPKPLPVPKRPTPRPVAIETPVTPMSIPTPVAEPPALSAEPATVDMPAVVDAGPAAGADVSLAYASRTAVPYPPQSTRNREQGTVMLRVSVDSGGRPTAVDIVRSSGHARLDRAAREAVRQWRFRPVQRNGVAVPASGLVPIEFNLANA